MSHETLVDFENAKVELHKLVRLTRCPLVECRVSVMGEHSLISERDPNRPGKETEHHDRPVVFRIASFVKILIDLAFCIIADKGDVDLDLKKKAFDTFYGTSEQGLARGRRLDSDPVIDHLLLHMGSFKDLNRMFLGPGGTFMFSNVEEFIDVAVGLSNKTSGNSYEYSAANHIFAAQILERLIGTTLDKILDEYIFKPFKLTHSTLNKQILQSWVNNGEVTLAQGYRVCANLEEVDPVPEHYQYMDNSLETAFLGAWSTTEDLDKLFCQLFAAFHGSKDAPISRETVNRFFARDWSAKGEHYTLAGVQVHLTSDQTARESPNRLLSTNSQPIYTLGAPGGKRKSEPMQLIYKGASMTGFAGTLYVVPDMSLCVVALANIAGPIDPTPHAAHILLQEILLMEPPVNIPVKIENNLDALLAIPRQIEREDADALLWPSDNFEKFVGSYQSRLRQLVIEIKSERLICFRRGQKSSPYLPARSSGNTIRIVPGRSHSIIDRLKAWRSVDFQWVRRGSETLLYGNNGEECYTKIEE